MGMTMSKATVETTIEGLVRLYYSNQALEKTTTSTKKAEEIRSAFKRGVAEGLASFLFFHRGQCLPRFKTVPMIFESDVRGILHPTESEWVNAAGDEKPLLMDGLVAKLIEFAVPADLLATDEEVRKQAVLEGLEPARSSDALWIEELAQKKRREVEELISLLQPKVNTAPKRVVAHGPGHLETYGKVEPVYDGECVPCAMSGVGACDDAPHPRRPVVPAEGDEPKAERVVAGYHRPSSHFDYGPGRANLPGTGVDC